MLKVPFHFPASKRRDFAKRFPGLARAALSGQIPLDTKLQSNEFECKTQKFLKNRQSLIFQKLAGGGFAPAIPIRFLSKANWYEMFQHSPHGGEWLGR
jgi:hypothetical protein